MCGWLSIGNPIMATGPWRSSGAIQKPRSSTASEAHIGIRLESRMRLDFERQGTSSRSNPPANGQPAHNAALETAKTSPAVMPGDFVNTRSLSYPLGSIVLSR
jgi:hypothetical protein